MAFLLRKVRLKAYGGKIRSRISKSFFKSLKAGIHQNIVNSNIVIDVTKEMNMKVVSTMICPNDGSEKAFSMM